MPNFHPVDIHVGKRMRQRRTLSGMSQRTLGAAAGISFQQIQRFEDGSNRCSSSQLYEFAKVLDVPVSYFFDEMPSQKLIISGRLEKDPLIKRETLELVRAYYKISNNRSRRCIFEMVKAIGAAPMADSSRLSRRSDKK